MNFVNSTAGQLLASTKATEIDSQPVFRALKVAKEHYRQLTNIFLDQ